MNTYTIVDSKTLRISDVFFFTHQAFLLKVEFEPEVFPGGEFSASFVSDYVVVADTIDAAKEILNSAFRYSKFKVVSWYQLPNSTYVQYSLKNKSIDAKLF